MEKRIICITNVELDEPGGRSHALKSRLKFLERHGWKVELFVIRHYYESLTKLWSFKKKIEQENPIFVWSMNNPFTLHLPPLFLKEFNNVDFIWIVEFRDPIYLNPDPKKLKSFYRIIDKKIIEKADYIVILKGMQADLMDYAKEYGLLISNKSFMLPFAGIDENCKSVGYRATLPFTISYAGSFYKGWIEPLTFLSGFRKFINTLKLSPDVVKINFFGDWNERYGRKVRELDLVDYVEVHGWLNRNKLSQYLQNSHLFLYIAGFVDSNRKNISYKIWDYLCFARPILALCGERYLVKDFILKNRFGYVANYGDSNDIAKKLIQAYLDFKTGNVYKIIRALLHTRQKFNRRSHDEIFAQIFDAIYEEVIVKGI